MVWFLAFIFIIFVPVLRNPKISFRNSLQRVLVCTVLIGLAVLTFASMGGGKKSKTTAVKNDFVPIRTTNGFTLKSGPLYKGSSIISQEKNKNTIVMNSLMTYQKGNTTFILPYQQKISIPSAANCNKNSNSLQLLNLKVRMHK